MLDDALVRDEESHEHDAPTLLDDTLTSDLHIGDNGSDAETADTLLNDLLRRRSRQHKNNTND
jgi:hypothetical protein